jgi:protein phosphatase 1 regulatory subunit 3A/B/C/D/E
MKIRSLSETEALNKKKTVEPFTLSDLKRELDHMVILEEEEKRSKPKSKHSVSRAKKKVSFADDHGAQLYAIRVMQEPSDVPPKLDYSVIRNLLGEAADEDARPSSTWVVNFSQPACEYLKFRETLEAQGVGLENVLVKNERCRLVGTVKVKNISFEKQVTVRYTDNNWESYMEQSALYMPGPAGEIYDTFSFDFEIPCDDSKRQRIAFCVCFRTGEAEFWDSNGGKNYEIISERLREEMLSPKPTTRFSRQRRKTGLQGMNDPYMMDSDTKWGEFSSWKDIASEGPYY